MQNDGGLGADAGDNRKFLGRRRQDLVGGAEAGLVQREGGFLAHAGDAGQEVVRRGRLGLLPLRQRLALPLTYDVEMPADELGGEADVLASASDRQRELILGDDDDDVMGVLVDLDGGDLGGGEGVAGELLDGRRVPDNVDLLAR